MNQNHRGKGDNIAGNKNINITMPFKIGIALILSIVISIFYITSINPDNRPDFSNSDYNRLNEVQKEIQRITSALANSAYSGDFESEYFKSNEKAFNELRLNIYNEENISEDIIDDLSVFFSLLQRMKDPNAQISKESLQEIVISIAEKCKIERKNFKNRSHEN